jgi:hypothetical protein
MPHDRNGEALKPGDQVLVPCVVKEVHGSSDFCNVSLETIQPEHPSNQPSKLVLNSHQVVLSASAPPDPPPGPDE